MDNNYKLIVDNIDYDFICLWEYDGFLMGIDQEKKTLLYWNSYVDNYAEYSLITFPDEGLMDMYLSNRLDSSKLFLLDNIKQIGIVFHSGKVIPVEFTPAIPEDGHPLGYNFFIQNANN